MSKRLREIPWQHLARKGNSDMRCWCAMLRKVFVCVCVLVCGVLFGQDSDLVQVKGKGTGENETAALKDAYRDAVETAVGMYVDAEQMMKNGQFIKDEILTQSNAYIEDYTKIDQKVSGGLVTITILAKVRKQALTKRISGTMETKTFNVGTELKKFHAQETTVAKRGADGASLLKKNLEGIHVLQQLYDVSIISKEPVIIKSDGNVCEVAWLFKLEVNRARYFGEFLPRMKKVLGQISITEPKMFRANASEYKTQNLVNYTKQYCYGNGCPSFPLTLESSFFRSLSLGMEGKLDFSYAAGLPTSWDNDSSIIKEIKKNGMMVFTIDSDNKAHTLIKGSVFTLDLESVSAYEKWREEEKKRKCVYTVLFLDEDGEELAANPILFVDYNQYSKLGLERIVPLEGNAAHYTVVGWVITPWIGATSSEYYQWFKFKLPKDDLPKVKSIKVELEKYRVMVLTT